MTAKTVHFQIMVGPKFDYLWKRIFRFNNAVLSMLLSMLEDVPIDSEASVVTSSILKSCWLSLQRCSEFAYMRS
jgi:hypothetical protein